MSEPTGVRELGHELLHELAAMFPPELGVVEGRMFNGIGLSGGGRFFGFISHTGALALKLPRQTVQELIDAGRARPLTMGRRTMREWVSLSQPAGGDVSDWYVLAEQARVFVQSGN